MDTLGNLLRSLGDFHEAERLLQKARTLRANLTSAQESRHIEAEIARNHFYMGWLRQAQGRYTESQQEYQVALSIRQRLYGTESLPVAELEFHIGWMNLENKQKVAAKEHLQRCLQLRQKLLPEGHSLILVAQMALLQSDGQNLELTTLASNAEQLLGKELAGPTIALAARVQLDRKLGRHDQAKKGYAELVTICLKIFGQEHPITALLQGDFAGYLWDLGDYREAFPLIQQAISTGQRFAPTHPQLNLARSRFAFELLLAGRWEESAKHYTEALTSPGLTTSRRHEILHGLIWASLQTGKPNEALKYAQQTHQVSEGLSLEFQAWSHYCLARMLTLASRQAEAKPHDQAAIRLAQEVQLDQCSSLFLDRMSIIFNRDGNATRAEELLRLAITKEQKLRGDSHPRVADRLHGLGTFLMGKNRTDEAAPLLRRALQIRENRLPPDDARLLEIRRVVERLHDPS